MPQQPSLTARLQDTARQDPERDAIVTPDGCCSYRELLDRVDRETAMLTGAGIGAESIVGICIADDPAHLVATLALLEVGASSFTLPGRLAPDTDSRYAFLTHRLTADGVTELRSAKEPAGEAATKHEPAGGRILFSTSGTTGTPKLVEHCDSDLVAQAHRHINSPSERFACLGSMEENFVKRHRLYCLAMGATNVFPGNNGNSLEEQCLRLDVNVLHVTAFQARELLAVPGIAQLRDIRLKLGGSLVPETLRQQLRHGITGHLQCGYGTTETGAISFTATDDHDPGESVGQPLPGIEVRVVDANRHDVDAGERGELAIRADGMFRGYHGQPGLTAERLEDGWFYTGDVGYLDDAGRIHLCGRADDMFVFNSMNIYPQDIESAICQHPAVRDAAVIPRPSEVHGCIPVALLVWRDSATADIAALREFVRERTGARCPRQFVAVDEIPRNATGKIARSESAARLTNENNVRRSIVQIVNDRRDPPFRQSEADAFIRGTTNLRLKDADLDSFSRMNLLVMLEVDYDTVIAPEVLRSMATLGDVADHVDRAATDAGATAYALPDGCHIESPLSDSENYLLRFFRRVFSYCPTVAQLHKALATLDHRLTPADIRLLQAQFAAGRLIPANAAGKFHAALAEWFGRLDDLMRMSGKPAAEAFTAVRKAPAVTLFRGQGSATGKTLLVCFAGAGSRQMLMPNAVWLQHIDAGRYDVLVIGEPRRQGYRLGVPLLGNDVTEVVDWLRRQKFLRRYAGLRTIGCSAGGHAAVIAACRLRAELGVSAGGRFHSERYPLRILARIRAMRRAVRAGGPARIIASYATDKTRDRQFAMLVAWLANANRLGVTLDGEKIGHLLLARLVERGKLTAFLECTLFLDPAADAGARGAAELTLSMNERETFAR